MNWQVTIQSETYKDDMSFVGNSISIFNKKMLNKVAVSNTLFKKHSYVIFPKNGLSQNE